MVTEEQQKEVKWSSMNGLNYNSLRITCGRMEMGGIMLIRHEFVTISNYLLMAQYTPNTWRGRAMFTIGLGQNYNEKASGIPHVKLLKSSQPCSSVIIAVL